MIREIWRLCFLKAFVLINTDMGQEGTVVEAIKEVPGVKKVNSLYGIYDVIVEVESETMDNVRNIVFNNIRRLPSVKTTITLITYGEALIRE
jgi:DNA-binding Lrp family transcriptional regulator